MAHNRNSIATNTSNEGQHLGYNENKQKLNKPFTEMKH